MPTDATHRVTPYLCAKNAAAALEFYARAFGATERMRLGEANGRIGHAEFAIGDAVVMLSDEYREMNVVSPESLGGTPVTIHLYVPDVDALVERAVRAGATLERPVADQFYGDRSGTIRDPFGHRWIVSTHKEDLTEDEVQRRYRAMTSH